MFVFVIVFLISYISLKQGVGVLDIMPYRIEDMIVMGFSVLGVFKSVVEVSRR